MKEHHHDDDDDEEHLMEAPALERLIQVMDVCGLLPDSQSPSSELESSLERVQAIKTLWLQDKNDLQRLLSLEDVIAVARSARVGNAESITKQLESIHVELECIHLGDTEREENWEHFLGSILVETERACHHQLQLLEELDTDLDEIFHDTAIDAFGARNVNDNTGVLEKLRRARQQLLCSDAVQTARSLLFDLEEPQLLVHNADCGEESIETYSEREFFPAKPLLDALTAKTAVESFQCFCNHTPIERSTFTVVSITGDEGTGKSYCLDQMEAYQASFAPHITIIRPSIPLDILLPSVGDAENTICSIFDSAAISKSCAVLLDNADEIWSSDDKKQIGGRIGPFLLDVLSLFRRSLAPYSNVMVVICSKRDASAYGMHADITYHLSMPEIDQRRAFLEEELSAAGEGRNSVLTEELAEMTAGRSYAELTQHMRQAFEQLAMSCEDESSVGNLMTLLKERLSKYIPPSLRTGRLDTNVEATVLSGLDLDLSQEDFEVFPFRGNNAKKAWNSLQRTICVPFCYYRRFLALSGVDYQSKSKGSLMGGILLAGPSGTGKSAIAAYCAKVIAKTVPMVTVLLVSCTSLIHKEVGSSEQSIRRLFEAGRKSCPCIIILEGIENIGAARGNDLTTEGTMDRVLSTLLVELDGAESGNLDGRLAIVATTIDETWVDAALKRPGRLGNAVILSEDWDNCI